MTKEEKIKELKEIYKDDEFLLRSELISLEHNNGWIKIESEEDLPKKGEYYWSITNKNNTPTERWFNKNWMINDGDGEITHYQPIVKPKPPIY